MLNLSPLFIRNTTIVIGTCISWTALYQNFMITGINKIFIKVSYKYLI